MEPHKPPLLTVFWGDDVTVSIRPSESEWCRIIRGERVTITGDGYGYDGESFCDYWDFSPNSQLVVHYGRKGDLDNAA